MRRAMIAGLAAGVIATVAAGVAAVATAKTGGGCHQPVTDERGATVDLRQNCTSPTVLRLGAGEMVTFTNRDQTVHTVTGAGTGAGQGWSSYDELAEGGTLTMTFDEDGIYPYFCILHPSMIGVVVVGGAGGPVGTNVLAASVAGVRATQPPESGGDGPSVVAASGRGAAIALAVVAVAYGAVAAMRRRSGAHG